MKRPVYYIGRGLQIAGLLFLPASIWAGEIRRSESEAITILVVSVVVFYLGHLACQLASR